MPPEAAEATAVVILAGGRASRFPGKLCSDAGGVPLLLRVYRNVRGIGPVYVSANELPADLAREMECSVVADERPGLGPLAGLVSTFARVAEPRCFVVAGDAPFAGREVFAQLDAAWNDRCDAAVAESGGKIEPLCAIYATQPFLRAARPELETGSRAVRAVAESLRHVRVTVPSLAAANINTPADRDALIGARA